jgi:peptide/nickel transport system permease protein
MPDLDAILDYFGAIARRTRPFHARRPPALTLVAERIPPRCTHRSGASDQGRNWDSAGIYAALHRGSAIDRAVMIPALARLTVPS